MRASRPTSAAAANSSALVSAPLEAIEAARAEALDSLSAAASGASLCTLRGERLPAAKYHEGAVAALGDARRAVRDGQAAPDPESWGAQWAEFAERDDGWRAYVTGGRAALASLGR